MGWADGHIARLALGETVQFRPRGHSMTGKINDGQLDPDLRRCLLDDAVELAECLIDHLAVHVIPDRRHVARLTGSQQVARPADFEIPHGDSEPRSQLGCLADGPQPLVGILGQRPVGREEQRGIGT